MRPDPLLARLTLTLIGRRFLLEQGALEEVRGGNVREGFWARLRIPLQRGAVYHGEELLYATELLDATVD